MSLTLLLDLDDTLLDTNLEAFMPAYFQALAQHLANHTAPNTMLRARAETDAMTGADRVMVDLIYKF